MVITTHRGNEGWRTANGVTGGRNGESTDIKPLWPVEATRTHGMETYNTIYKFRGFGGSGSPPYSARFSVFGPAFLVHRISISVLETIDG